MSVVALYKSSKEAEGKALEIVFGNGVKYQHWTVNTLMAILHRRVVRLSTEEKAGLLEHLSSACKCRKAIAIFFENAPEPAIRGHEYYLGRLEEFCSSLEPKWIPSTEPIHHYPEHDDGERPLSKLYFDLLLSSVDEIEPRLAFIQDIHQRSLEGRICIGALPILCDTQYKEIFALCENFRLLAEELGIDANSWDELRRRVGSFGVKMDIFPALIDNNEAVPGGTSPAPVLRARLLDDLYASVIWEPSSLERFRKDTISEIMYLRALLKYGRIQEIDQVDALSRLLGEDQHDAQGTRDISRLAAIYSCKIQPTFFCTLFDNEYRLSEASRSGRLKRFYRQSAAECLVELDLETRDCLVLDPFLIIQSTFSTLEEIGGSDIDASGFDASEASNRDMKFAEFIYQKRNDEGFVAKFLSHFLERWGKIRNARLPRDYSTQHMHSLGKWY
ncbi:hypothetical protein N7471_010540 [Penicillium samsonianum]|uniref:uncharacterized protein n=1 Tax=Penicillium samsonianum TaxID=1882272 RepID=UPI00254766FA|nr:uncharacterized protein N7471_010540 [Penicillium samsonianum]KAJ6126047.1 hypothetical protein N7471_010540 [Penicillium samsonianum]